MAGEPMDTSAGETITSSTGFADGITFSGKAEELPALWLHMTLKIALDSDVRDHVRVRCAYLASTFKGMAMDWFARTLPQQPTLLDDYETLTALVKEVFGVTEDVATAQAQAKITHLKQTRSVPEYIAEFESLADQLGWPVSARQAFFYQGLKADLKDRLIASSVPDYTSLRREAKSIEAQVMIAHGKMPDQSPSAPSKKKKRAAKKKTPCAKCGRTNHATADCYATTKKVGMIRATGAISTPESQRIRGLLIQGQRLTALVDTGAEVSCIRADLARDVPNASPVCLTGPDGHTMVAQASYVLETIDNVAQKLYLVPGLTEEVVLGLPYLQHVTPVDVFDVDILSTPQDGGRLRTLSLPEDRAMNVEVDKLLKEGIIRTSQATTASNILFVPKKSGDLRMVVDFRELNKVTRRDSYPLPLLRDVLEKARHAQWFTVIDLVAAFHLIRVARGREYLLAFRTSRGMYEFTRMPFGVTNGPATFQRFIDQALFPHHAYALAYLDDILVHAETEAECQQRSEAVTRTLRDLEITINEDKLQWVRQDVTLLGTRVTNEFIEPIQDYQTILDWPEPTNITELQSWLGIYNYWAPFVPIAAEEAAPLYRLTGKNEWEWRFQEKMAFSRTKEAALSSIRLFPFQPNSPPDVYTDASGYAIGAIMFQNDRPIAIISRSLSPAERNYTTTERELLAMVFAAKKWRHYWESTREPIKIRTDHKALTQSLNAKGENRRINRWSLLLSQYQFELIFEPGSTNPADYPSRRADYVKSYGSSVTTRGEEEGGVKIHPTQGPVNGPEDAPGSGGWNDPNDSRPKTRLADGTIHRGISDCYERRPGLKAGMGRYLTCKICLGAQQRLQEASDSDSL
jgi:hypothetical protein